MSLCEISGAQVDTESCLAVRQRKDVGFEECGCRAGDERRCEFGGMCSAPGAPLRAEVRSGEAVAGGGRTGVGVESQWVDNNK